MNVMMLLSAFKRLLKLIFLGSEARGKYRPEQHYMRGPGPKFRERVGRR
jgi:hypothetical protein